MRAYLIIQSITPADSAGSDTFLMKRAIEEMGVECSVYAAQRTPEAAYSGEIGSFEALPEIKRDDIVIFVHKEGDKLCSSVGELSGRKLLVYHEPVRLFSSEKDYSCPEYEKLRAHYLSTERMKDVFEEAVVFSEEGRRDLISMGYKCPIRQRPLMLSEGAYVREDNSAVSGEEDTINIVYFGKLIPDEHIEDMIAAYACYRRYYNCKSRLTLVSDGTASEKYCRRLRRYAQLLSAEGIIYPPAASPEKGGEYIKNADAVFCGTGKGEFPEGAAKAIFMGVPVIARDSSSCRLLLGDSAELLEGYEPHITAAFIHRLITDSSFREGLRAVQRNEAGEHCYDKISPIFKGQMKEFMEKRGE